VLSTYGSHRAALRDIGTNRKDKRGLRWQVSTRSSALARLAAFARRRELVLASIVRTAIARRVTRAPIEAFPAEFARAAALSPSLAALNRFARIARVSPRAWPVQLDFFDVALDVIAHAGGLDGTSIQSSYFRDS
jgi:hypothetical protein